MGGKERVAACISAQLEGVGKGTIPLSPIILWGVHLLGNSHAGMEKGEVTHTPRTPPYHATLTCMA